MFLFRLVFYFTANLTALLIVNHWVSGFELSSQWINIAGAAILFSLLNACLRPLIKLIFAPFIIVTFGLFSLIINAGILYLLDIISVNININGLTPLWQAALIVTAFNVIIGIINPL